MFFSNDRELQKIRDNKGVSEAVFTDPSKAFDCISHELLIVKLNVYGFDTKSLNFILAYFTNRKQKIRIGSSFSDFLKIIFGVPQGFILGPLLFIIYVRDLFMEYDAIEFAGYVDDATPFHALTRISKYMSLQKGRILINLFLANIPI